MRVLNRLLIIAVPVLIVGVTAGLIAAAAGWTGRAFTLAEAVTVIVATPVILHFVDRSGRGHGESADHGQRAASL